MRRLASALAAAALLFVFTCTSPAGSYPKDVDLDSPRGRAVIRRDGGDRLSTYCRPVGVIGHTDGGFYRASVCDDGTILLAPVSCDDPGIPVRSRCRES